MDNGLVRLVSKWYSSWLNICLNPYCSGQWSRTTREATPEEIRMRVLILIVVDNGLVLTNAMFDGFKRNVDTSLNPYCSGQWSRTLMTKLLAKVRKCLNPYCSGQWSRTFGKGVN